MRLAAIGTLGVVQLALACGPDWDALTDSRPLAPIEAGTRPSSTMLDAGTTPPAGFSRARSTVPDERLIRDVADAGDAGDAGPDSGLVLVEKAR